MSQCRDELAGQSPELAEQVASLAGGVLDVAASCAPERSAEGAERGPSETGSADAVVFTTLGPVFYAALLVAGREGRRLTLNPGDCRAVIELGGRYAARSAEAITASRELEQERRGVARLREELQAAHAARDEALELASSNAERAHRAETERDAAELETDRDQARADLAASEEAREGLARTVMQLRAKLDRRRSVPTTAASARPKDTLAERYFREALAWVEPVDATEKLELQLWRLRDRNKLLTHRLREARRQLGHTGRGTQRP